MDVQLEVKSVVVNVDHVMEEIGIEGFVNYFDSDDILEEVGNEAIIDYITGDEFFSNEVLLSSMDNETVLNWLKENISRFDVSDIVGLYSADDVKKWVKCKECGCGQA